MRFAVGLPNVREYGDPQLLVELAVEAERAGWDGVFIWDHLVYQQEGDPVADPWTTVSVIAARTSRVRLGVTVLALARRRPWLVARATAALDVLSGGRLVVGVGLGSLPEQEYAAFDEDPSDRVRAERLDEGLEILNGLWSGERFAFEGRHYRVAPTVFRPRPVQFPRPPVWVAGQWPARRPFRRAARWDGVFPIVAGVGHDEMPDPATVHEIIAYTLAHRHADGPFDVVLEGQSPPERERAASVVAPYAEVGVTWWVEKLGWFRGPVAAVAERIRQGPPAAR